MGNQNTGFYFRHLQKFFFSPSLSDLRNFFSTLQLENFTWAEVGRNRDQQFALPMSKKTCN
jgi:hypothetical protein